MKSLLLAPLLLALAAPLASAQTTVTWTGAVSTSWSDANNWSPAQVPGALDHAVIVSAPNAARTPGGASTIAELTLSSGALTIFDSTTLTITGDAHLNGGTLDFFPSGASFDSLVVSGNLIQTGTAMGTTTTQSRIFVAGDWFADTSFSMPNGWVYLDGPDSVIGGLAPTFHRVNLAAGVNTLMTDVQITGQLTQGTGTTAGTGWLEFDGSVQPHGGGSKTLHQVRITSGNNRFASTTFGQLELTGGTLEVTDNSTISVPGDAKLIGGTLSFEINGASLDVLDIEGDLIQTATAMGTDSTQTRIRVAGNWQTATPFVLPNGWVELDGPDSTIGGTAPSFHRLNLVSGVNTLLTNVGITGKLIQGTGTTAGAGWLEFNGSVQPHGGSSKTLHQVRVVSGTNQFYSTTFGQLELTGGTLEITDNSTITVPGDAKLIGGTLSFAVNGASIDILDIEGDLIQTGTVAGTTSTQARIRVAGNWTADGPFILPEGLVELDGGAQTIAGLAPAFKRLTLPTGVKTINSKTLISGTITSTGGSTTGPEWLEVVGNTESISTGANLIHNLRIAAGNVPFVNSTIGHLEMTGGEMLIKDNVTLTVTGDMDLLGGTLDFATAGASLDTIDVEGDFYQNGASLGTASDQLQIFCAGNWRSDTGFTLLNGWVYLDGLADTTIDGTNTAFNNLRVTNAKRTVLNGLHVRGDLEVRTGATVELLTDLELGGDLTCVESGAAITGGAEINMTATGFIHTNASPIPHCNVSAGLRTLKNSTLASLNLVGGEFQILDNSTCHILGDAAFNGGVLSFAPSGASFDTLDIDGNVSQSMATLGTTSTQSRIFVAGNWAAANPFTMDSGWVYLDGTGGTIGGPAPAFKRLSLLSGVRTVNTDTEITGTVTSSGGSTDGPAYLDCTANTEAISTGSNKLAHLRVSAGTVNFFNTTLGDLEIEGGEMFIHDNIRVSVEGDARLLGGTLSWHPSGASLEYLDVAGSVTESGTLAGSTSNQSRLQVAGDWTGTGAFVMSSGWVELDGTSSTEIKGASPAFLNLRLENGARRMLADTSVVGDVEIASNGTFDVVSSSLDVAGDWHSVATGASAIGTGPILFSGTGSLQTNAAGVPPISITGGTRLSLNATTESLTVQGGSLVIQDNSTLHVLGDADFNSGSLGFAMSGASFDTLDVDGNLTQVAATISSTSSQSRIFVAGGWSADSPFELTNGWVYLDGGNASIGGVAPSFKRLSLTSGIKSVITDATVSGTIQSTGGSTAGPGFLDCTASAQAISTGANLINKLRVSGGVIPFFNSRVGQLEITGGELVVNDNATLTVDGDADLIGGKLSFAVAGASLDKLDIGGNLTQTGTIAGTSSTQSRLYCAGDWSSNSSFAMQSGTVYLDGSTATQLGGASPTFPTLRITSATRQAPGDSTLKASSLVIEASGALEVTGASLRTASTSVTVQGRLSVLGGGRLAPDPASPLTIDPTGKLELIGQAGNPAVLEGNGGSFSCTVNGTISASHFEVREPSGAGLVLNGPIAAAPDDLRQGLFTLPSAAAGSTLLTLGTTPSSPLVDLVFEDPLGVGTFNVRRNSPNTAALVNANGAFAGAAFEDDAQGTLDWLTATPSVVSSFSAAPGPESATLSWTSTTEDAALSSWRIMSAPQPNGPWSLVADATPVGPSSYSLVATGLAADVPTYFRLLEVQGAIYLQGSDSATPWSAGLPANVVTVGPGGTFATIQAAVDAATGGTYVVSVAAGSYPSFSVFAPASGELHIIADGSGPVLIDASLAPVDIGPTTFGQVVELVGVDITGGNTGHAVFVHDNLGSVLFDSVVATAGAGQVALRAQSSLAVNVGRCTLSGTPGLSVGAAASVYVGRGAVDVLDIGTAGSVETCGVTPGSTIVDPAGQLVAHPGVMPDLQVASFQSLASPFTVTLDAAPGTFYQIATGAGLIPLDLDDPSFWQMLLLVNFTNYSLVGSGFTDGVTGQATLAAELPGDPALLGATLPVQAWAVTLFPAISVRFSNLRTIVAMP